VTFVVPPSLSIGPPVTIVTKAPRPKSTISGRVVDQDGRPVNGLMVGAFKKTEYEPSGDPDSQFSWTADDGSFVIFARDEAGDEPMEVRCTRTRDRWGLLGECAWGERDLKLRLLAGATVAVRVVTEDGSPVEDFAVRCVPSEGVASAGPARLGGHFAEGLAEIRNVAPGPHRLLVFPFSSELAPSEWQAIECPRSGRTEVRVTVARTIARKVHVRIPGGAPIAGTKVELTFGGETAPVLQSRPFAISLESGPTHQPVQQRIDEGVTDAAGGVVLRGPKSAGNAWIRALGPGHPPAMVALVGWGAALEPIEVVVAPSCTINGRVGPLEVLDALDATNRRDSDSYALDYGPRPHAYAKPNAEVERGDRPRILALTPAEASAAKDDKNPWWPLDREAPIGLDGAFEIADLPAGVFQLHLVTFTDRSGRYVFREPLAVVTTSAERPVEVTLSIARYLPRSLAGKVTLDGLPLANAEVELFWPGKVTGAEGSDTRPTAIAATLRTDRRGMFVVRPLAGEYAAVAVVPGAQDQPPIRIPAESAVQLDTETKGPLEIAFTWKTVRFAEEKGQRTGHWITWHANGQKHSEGAYDAGRREGSWTFWRVDGSVNPDLTGTYADGVRTGP
jgi:hypothetical protein